MKRNSVTDSSNAAEQIIEAKPLVPHPHGLYISKAYEIQKHCAGLAITADDIRNRVRAIDKKQIQENAAATATSLASKNTNAAVATAAQPEVVSSTIASSASIKASASTNAVATAV
jgi:hypothetical protein